MDEWGVEVTHLYYVVVGHGNFVLQNMKETRGLNNNNNDLYEDLMIAKYQ